MINYDNAKTCIHFLKQFWKTSNALNKVKLYQEKIHKDFYSKYQVRIFQRKVKFYLRFMALSLVCEVWGGPFHQTLPPHFPVLAIKKTQKMF